MIDDTTINQPPPPSAGQGGLGAISPQMLAYYKAQFPGQMAANLGNAPAGANRSAGTVNGLAKIILALQKNQAMKRYQQQYGQQQAAQVPGIPQTPAQQAAAANQGPPSSLANPQNPALQGPPTPAMQMPQPPPQIPVGAPGDSG